VVVGYSNLEGGTAGVSAGIKESIICQKEILYLTLVDHSFEFGEDGSLELTAKYRGRLEGLMNDRSMNILLPAGGNFSSSVKRGVTGFTNDMTLTEIENKIKELKAKPRPSSGPDPNKTKIENLKKAQMSFFTIFKQAIYSDYINRLVSKGMVYSIEVDTAEFEEFKKFQVDPGGPWPPKLAAFPPTRGRIGDSPIEEIGATADPEAFEKMRIAAAARLSDAAGTIENKINYFFLGDLLGIVLDNIFGENIANAGVFQAGGWIFGGPTIASDTITGSDKTTIQDLFKNFKMILGNITVDFKGPSGGEKTISLANIPISLEAFSNFMINNVLSKDRTNYPFFSFVNDLLSDLVVGFLSSDCFGGLVEARVRPRTQYFTVPTDLTAGLRKGGALYSARIPSAHGDTATIRFYTLRP
jgi:hypothetical protein